jgi:hypothetical protein
MYFTVLENIIRNTVSAKKNAHFQHILVILCKCKCKCQLKKEEKDQNVHSALGSFTEAASPKRKKNFFLYSAEILTGGRAVLLESCP